MENIVNSVCLAVLILIEIAFYFTVVGVILPKWFIRIRYTVKGSTDRGLKKYTYPDGRGVIYEPHPSIRKYINRYALFTNEGYKYIKCRLDGGVKRLNYTVIMFNNRSKVIDVIDVNEIKPRNCETNAIAIHQDTSYVSLVLNSVNGDRIDRRALLYCGIGGIIVYSVAVSVSSFAQTLFIYGMINLFLNQFTNAETVLRLNVAEFILPSLFIGIVAGALSYLYVRSKGVRWSK